MASPIEYVYRFTEYEYEFDTFDTGDQREVSTFFVLFFFLFVATISQRAMVSIHLYQLIARKTRRRHRRLLIGQRLVQQRTNQLNACRLLVCPPRRRQIR